MAGQAIFAGLRDQKEQIEYVTYWYPTSSHGSRAHEARIFDFLWNLRGWLHGQTSASLGDRGGYQVKKIFFFFLSYVVALVIRVSHFGAFFSDHLATSPSVVFRPR